MDIIVRISPNINIVSLRRAVLTKNKDKKIVLPNEYYEHTCLQKRVKFVWYTHSYIFNSTEVLQSLVPAHHQNRQAVMTRTRVQGSPDHGQDQREQRTYHQNHQAAMMRTEVQGNPDHGQDRREQRRKRGSGQSPSTPAVIVREKALFASLNSLGSRGVDTVPNRCLNQLDSSWNSFQFEPFISGCGCTIEFRILPNIVLKSAMNDWTAWLNCIAWCNLYAACKLVVKLLYRRVWCPYLKHLFRTPIWNTGNSNYGFFTSDFKRPFFVYVFQPFSYWLAKRVPICNNFLRLYYSSHFSQKLVANSWFLDHKSQSHRPSFWILICDV